MLIALIIAIGALIVFFTMKHIDNKCKAAIEIDYQKTVNILNADYQKRLNNS